MEMVLPLLTFVLVTIGSVYMFIGIKHDLRVRREKIAVTIENK